MATVGYGTTPTFGYIYAQANNIAAGLITMPAGGGRLTSLSVYCASYPASSVAGVLSVWNAQGSLLASTAGVTVTSTAQWLTASFSTPYAVGGGTNLLIGVQVPLSSSGLYMHYDNIAGKVWDFASNSAYPGAITNFTQYSNQVLGAYASYTPGAAALIWNGTAWVAAPIAVWNGTAWVAAPIAVWNGSAWV